ncbi:uncharacterized protein MONBRDRAFT_25237 [Monosiga brevicollis MX1]|uniref:Glutaminase n=1 Tax=Monosiga brevicollis TaxID=81824 RepID=A9UYT7_MONBE|nr:uncharacterized protein MONBRDRAFT_25237 [Monosiga brevicollis MX1]EDQ89518.1 predicted protein [Monosiga brevicollis MX1]|eukprot:XP_001745547.1 hypothetical protein [Monosiga brevicollis MX1]
MLARTHGLLALVVALMATGAQADRVSFRAPAIPLVTTDPWMQVWMGADQLTDTEAMYWEGDERAMAGFVRIDGDAYRFLGNCQNVSDCPAAMTQTDVVINATATGVHFADPKGRVSLEVVFQTMLFPSRTDLMARPVSYVDLTVTSLAAQSHAVEVYFDMTAQHVVNTVDQQVQWSTFQQSGVQGVSISHAHQQALDEKGDRIGRDWGYLYLGTRVNTSATFRAGGGEEQRRAFYTTGALPSSTDNRQPRAAQDDMPVVGAAWATTATANPASLVLQIAYDDVATVNYYGHVYHGYWTRLFDNIFDVMQQADHDYPAIRALGASTDAAVRAASVEAGGDKYSVMTTLVFRQVLAATQLVWADDRNTTWLFLKEISTNGDMQTMDVIFPSSPMLLYSNASLLALLLEPVLAYANNETNTPYGSPYSPHQLGTFPIADATTDSQEPMPMENTGNMFLMLLATVQRTKSADFFYPQHWDLLTTWAEYLNASLPYPANQLCTDDFTGRLANNTNLAAKGIVALEAYVQLCHLVGAPNCEALAPYPAYFAHIWETQALDTEPTPHYRLAYNMTGTYSLKYNLLWQHILDMEGPFNYSTVASNEFAYYRSVQNQYGTPLDERHTWVMFEWLAWASCFASSKSDFQALFEPTFDAYNASSSRVPMTDLYDSITADASMNGFFARPVVGGVYAKLILP